MPAKFKYNNPSILRSMWMWPMGACKTLTHYSCYFGENTIDFALTIVMRLTFLGGYIPYAHQQVHHLFNGHPAHHPGILGIFNRLFDGIANLGRAGVMVEDDVELSPVMDAVIHGGEQIGEAVIDAVEEIGAAVLHGGLHIGGAVIDAELGVVEAVIGAALNPVLEQEEEKEVVEVIVDNQAPEGVFASTFATIEQDIQALEFGLEHSFLFIGSAALASSIHHSSHK